jgi:hypothetical protein
MPSHLPPHLDLAVPVYEEDIGDLSPYSVPLAENEAVSSTLRGLFGVSMRIFD